MDISKRNRKALTPILAELVLIAITLVAGAAFAGFVFGLFGSFTSTARVTVSYSTMVPAEGGGLAATGSSILALNSGASNTHATGLTLTYGGQSCTAEVAMTTITAGAPSGVSLTVTPGSCSAFATAGETYAGSLSLANGGQVPFTGQFS